MRRFLPLFVLCAAILANVLAEKLVYTDEYVNITYVSTESVPFRVRLPNFRNGNIRPHVRLKKWKNQLRIYGPQVDNSLNCSYLRSIRLIGLSEVVAIPCNDVPSSSEVVSMYSISKVNFFNQFGPSYTVLWRTRIDNQIFFRISGFLRDLWYQRLYLRDTVTNCFVPQGYRNWYPNLSVTATLLAFPHCIAKVPFDSLDGWSGIKVFETYYYKTLVEIFGLLKNHWLYDNVHKSAEDELLAEYAPYDKLTIDNYKKWLVLPYRMIDAGGDYLYRPMHGRKLFETAHVNRTDGVIDMIEKVYGDIGFRVPTDDQLSFFHGKYSYKAVENVYYPSYFPYRLNTFDLSPIPTSSNVSTGDIEHMLSLYNCGVEAERAGFSLLFSNIHPGKIVKFPVRVEISPLELSVHTKGSTIYQLLYAALRRHVRGILHADVAPSRDSTHLLHSILQDERLVECYLTKFCDNIHMEAFPQTKCHSTYRDRNGLMQPIGQRIVDGCRSLSGNRTDELHVWTTTTESKSIQEALMRHGHDFTALDAEIGGHSAVIIVRGGLVAGLGDAYGQPWPQDRGLLLARLRQMIELNLQMGQFRVPELLSFAGVKRLVCVSNSLDANKLQYDGVDPKMVAGIDSIQLHVVRVVLNFPTILDIDRSSISSAMEDMSSLSLICDMNVFATAESTLAELEKAIDGRSETFDVLWRLRAMFPDTIPDGLPQTGFVYFSLSSSRFSQAVSYFRFSQTMNIELIMHNCVAKIYAGFLIEIKCKSRGKGLPEHIIGPNSTTRSEVVADLEKYAIFFGTLWQETSAIFNMQPGVGYSFFTTKPEVEADYSFWYPKQILSALVRKKFNSAFSEKPIEHSLEGLNLTVEEVFEAIRHVGNGSSTDIPLARYINNMLAYEDFATTEDPDESITFVIDDDWKLESLLLAEPDTISLLRSAGIDVRMFVGEMDKMEVNVRIPETYKSMSRMLTDDHSLRTKVASVMQIIKLDEVMRLKGYSMCKGKDGRNFIRRSAFVHHALLRNEDPCLSTYDPKVYITDADRDAMLLSWIGNTVFPRYGLVLNSYDNLQVIAHEFNTNGVVDWHAALDALMLGSQESVEFWKGVLGSISHMGGLSSRTNDQLHVDTRTRMSVIIGLLRTAEMFTPYGLFARVCPGQGKSLFSINLFKSEDSADIHRHFANRCPTSIGSSGKQFGERLKQMNPVRLLSKAARFIGGGLSTSSSHISKNSTAVESAHVEIGDMDDYVLQSIGFVVWYFGPNRITPLQVFNRAELDKLKTKIGYPSDGSIKVSDLAKAIDEVESLNVGQKDFYDDEFPDVPRTLSPAGKVVYNIFYKLSMEVCPICIADIYVVEDNQTIVGSCGHVYHIDCCARTIVEAKCAVCRSENPFER